MRWLLLGLLYAPVLHAQSQTTVTATINDSVGALATSGYVTFSVKPTSASILYRVQGTNVIAPSVGRCGINASGVLLNLALSGACLVWGNDVITPGNTTYDVQLFPNGTATQLIHQLLISGTTYSLSTPVFAPQVNINPAFQTIQTSPINVNLIPAATDVFNVGQSGKEYAAVYARDLFLTGSCVACSAAPGTTGNVVKYTGVNSLGDAGFLATQVARLDQFTPFSVLQTFSAGLTGTGNTGTLLPGTGILGTANTWTVAQRFPTVGVGLTPTRTLDVLTTTNDAIQFASTGTDSNSLIHLVNTTVQGPFTDYHSSVDRWAFGIGSIGNFDLRESAVGVDPVNGTTVFRIDPTGNFGFRGGANTCPPSGGSGTVYACTTVLGTPAPTVGTLVTLLPDVDSGASPTLNVNAAGAHGIFRAGGVSVVSAGDLKANKPVILTFDAASHWDVAEIANPLLQTTLVGSLPTAAAGNAGWLRVVSDSTAVAAEGQTCVGSSTNSALAFSDGTVWKCF